MGIRSGQSGQSVHVGLYVESLLSSTWYINKLMSGRRKQVFDLERADKPQISPRRICLKKALLPDPPPHQRQDVVEGGVCFGYQAACGNGNLRLGTGPAPARQSAKRGPRVRAWCIDGQIATLALGFQAEMGAGFFKGHFQRPAVDEIGDDAGYALGRVEAKKTRVGRSPCGSRTRTQRMTSGAVPVVYHSAVPVVQSTMVCVPPYHGTRLRCHRVVGWPATCQDWASAPRRPAAGPGVCRSDVSAVQTSGHPAAMAPARSPGSVDTGRLTQ